MQEQRREEEEALGTGDVGKEDGKGLLILANIRFPGGETLAESAVRLGHFTLCLCRKTCRKGVEKYDSHR